MRYDLTEEQELLRETTRRFLENEAPLSFVREHYDTPEGVPRDWWSKAAELGWVALGVPESAGGISLSGKPGQDLAIIAEEMGRLIAPGPFQTTAVCLDALSRGGSHDELIGRVISGEALVSWAFGEAGNRWDPHLFETAVESSSDDVVLRGAKAYVEAGAQADAYVVTARSGDGLAQVVVPADAEGVTVVPGRSLDFVRRFAEVRFHAVRLPASALLGDSSTVADQVERQIQLALLLQCAETNGAIERAFEFTVEYMGERYAFGRPIASYQALKHRVADHFLALHSCMATTDAALDAFDAGSSQSLELSRVAKTYVGTRSAALVSDLVQLTGGIGVTWEHDLHLYERRIAVNRAMYGTPEVHRAQVHGLISA